MATPTEILTTGGLANADLIVQAASATGLPLPILAAMVQKESGGQNVYGHDAGGVYSTLYGSVTVEGVTYGKGANIPVTQSNFAEFRRQVIDNGKTSNGVGPCQITYWGFFAQNPTYEFWDALQNLKGSPPRARGRPGRSDGLGCPQVRYTSAARSGSSWSCCTVSLMAGAPRPGCGGARRRPVARGVGRRAVAARHHAGFDYDGQSHRRRYAAGGVWRP